MGRGGDGLVNEPVRMSANFLGWGGKQTQTKMELWNVKNVRSALEKGELVSLVHEQKDLER